MKFIRNIITLLDILNYYFFKLISILVVNDISSWRYLFDKFLLNKYEKQSPEAKIPIVKPIKTITRLGGAANLINNINSLNRNCF